MKLRFQRGHIGLEHVAPHGGAWIETYITKRKGKEMRRVAPHGGAWIETCGDVIFEIISSSPLTEGRGLKQRGNELNQSPELVAPHGGAWIETTPRPRKHVKSESPLTEGRGLKRSGRDRWISELPSPLTEGRGLKHMGAHRITAKEASPLTEGRGLKPGDRRTQYARAPVAPHGGAWIETFFQRNPAPKIPMSPLTEGRGLKQSASTALCR